MRQSLVTPERFAEGRTFDEYVKYAGSAENLAREVSVATTPTLHQEAPPARTTGCASETRGPCWAQELDPSSFLVPGPVKDSRQVEDGRGGQHDQVGGESDRGVDEPRANLIVENLCLRQQLIVTR